MEVFAKELTKGRHLFPARAYAVLLETLLKRYILKEFVKTFLRLQAINITHKIVSSTIELAEGLTVERLGFGGRGGFALEEALLHFTHILLIVGFRHKPELQVILGHERF